MVTTSWVTTELKDFPKVLADEGLEMVHFERGFAVIGRNATGAPEPHLWLGDLYVHRQFRKRGVARDIVNRLSILARDTGLAAIHADVMIGSKTYRRSIEVLKRLGFKFHAADGKDLLVFRKQL